MLVAGSALQAGLLATSALFNSGTGIFYLEDQVVPANPGSTSLVYVRPGTFIAADPGTSQLGGSFLATGVATYGNLTTRIAASVSGSDTFPSITIYSSVFFFDTLTFFTPTGGNGTASLSVTMDGFGSVTQSLGPAGVYGRAYGGLLAGESGAELVWQHPDVTNASVTVTLLSQPIPFVSGVPVNIVVGLAANLWFRCANTDLLPNACNDWFGTGVTDFGHTALLTGIGLFDSTGAPINTFDISSESARPMDLMESFPNPTVRFCA